MYPRLRCRVWVLMLLLIPGSLCQAVWELGPQSAQTRFSNSAFADWELGVVYTSEMVVPAELACPANSNLTLHVLNLSPQKIRVTLSTGSIKVLIPGGQYHRLALGPQPAGAYTLVIEKPGEYAFDDHAGHRHEPVQIRLPLRSGTWPEQNDFCYRAVWIVRQDRFLPPTLILPTGRLCEVYLAGDATSRPRAWEWQGKTFEIKPGQVKMVDLRSCPGGDHPVPLPGMQAVLHGH
jgi:hypothetical protein